MCISPCGDCESKLLQNLRLRDELNQLIIQNLSSLVLSNMSYAMHLLGKMVPLSIS